MLEKKQRTVADTSLNALLIQNIRDLFLWCDDYHSGSGDGKQPSYVLNQVYCPTKAVVSNSSKKSRSTSDTANVCSDCGRCQDELKMNYVLVFIGLMLLLLGVVLGKLF